MEKTTVYIPGDLLATYSALSRRRHRAKAELMRDALREFAERQERILPDWVGAFDGKAEFDSTNVKS